MGGLEFNKVAAAVLMAGLIGMTTGKVADIFYTPEQAEKRGFSIEVVADAEAGEAGAADAGPVMIADFMGAADAAAGEALVKKCVACHSFDKGGANKVGPALYGVAGRGKASHGGFAYSDALKGLGGSWDDQALSEFLTKPSKYAKGTKMAFAGIKKPEDRANLIAYLKTLK